MAIAGIRAAAVLCAAAATTAAGGNAPPRHVPHLLPVADSTVAVPAGYPPPQTPADNPLTAEKIELGRRLFYEKRLSANETQSCASCHQQHLAFTDGRAHALGSTGMQHPRSAMSLVNVAYRRPLTWVNPAILTLEQQALVPLTNEHPVEMGMKGRLDELPRRLSADPAYVRLFAEAFPNERPAMTVRNIARAIASFERSIVSADSPYDRLVHKGDSQALSPEAWRGHQLFFSDRARCSTCHGGADFSTPAGSRFQNNGFTKSAERFRVPSLRNVAITAPYMHDGSVGTLAEVIDDYAAGGRVARETGKHPKFANVRAFKATPEERRALVAFLESLTDEHVVTNARLADPVAQRKWKVDAKHSDVSFRVRHLMSSVRGRFTRFSGTIIQGSTLASSSIDFTIEAGSIDTNEPERDKDLRSPDFFNVEKFPRITFRSSAIKEVSKDHYDVTGDLTMHGITKEITIPVTFLGEGRDPFFGNKVGFELSTTIRRSDYGITWNKALDSGGVLVGEDVAITINLEAIEDAEQHADLSAEGEFLARRGVAPANARQNAVEAIRAWHRTHDSSVEPSYRWQSIGPTATRSVSVADSGRITGILLSPVDRNLIVIGTSGGGIWRSTDGGERFSPVTDDQADLNVGAMAIAPSNPSVMYAAMGDVELGTGVLKSTDSGATWKRVTDATFPSRASASRIRVDPSNENTVWLVQQHALTESLSEVTKLALLKSTDGGATWKSTFDGAVSDVLIVSPDGKTVLLGAIRAGSMLGKAGIYHSSDAGDSWTLVYPQGDPETPPSYFLASAGNTTYAVAVDSLNDVDREQLVVSTDGGQHWTKRGDVPPEGRPRELAVNPRDGTLFFGGIGTYRSGDGGVTWTTIYTHPDHHAIAFDPVVASRVWLGNDGGLKRSDDDGRNFASVSERVPAMQFYSVVAHPTDPDIVVAGAQDNGLQLLSGRGVSTELFGGDFGNIAFDPASSRVLGASFSWSIGRVALDGSQREIVTTSTTLGDTRFAFILPLVQSRDGTVWVATYRLFATKDFGTTWSAPAGDLDLTTGKKLSNTRLDVLSAVAVSDSDPRTLYTGSVLGRMMITHDAAVTWSDITPATPGPVVAIAISHSNPAIAYAGFSGYGAMRVIKTTNAGAAWSDISAGLPNMPVDAIYLDARHGDTLYAGTDVGVFRFNESLSTWEPFDNGMPPVIVNSFTTTADGRMLVATYGRGVYELVESSERHRSVRH